MKPSVTVLLVWFCQIFDFFSKVLLEPVIHESRKRIFFAANESRHEALFGGWQQAGVIEGPGKKEIVHPTLQQKIGHGLVGIYLLFDWDLS